MAEIFKVNMLVHLIGEAKETGIIIKRIKKGWYKVKITGSNDVRIVHESSLFIKAGAWHDELTTRKE